MHIPPKSYQIQKHKFLAFSRAVTSPKCRESAELNKLTIQSCDWFLNVCKVVATCRRISRRRDERPELFDASLNKSENRENPGATYCYSQFDRLFHATSIPKLALNSDQWR